jgi:hypothetical protein
MSARKIALRIVGLAGFSLFAAFFALTFSAPGWLEQFASAFVEDKVAQQIDSGIDALQPPEGDSAMSRVAATLYQRNQQEIDRLKTALKANVHEQMATALARIRNLDCECRAEFAAIFEKGIHLDIALLQAGNDRIVDFIQSTYMRTVAELKRDIRVFTGSNAIVFLLLLLASFTKPRAIVHLFVPATLLAVATLICSYFYIFEQNWLLTIIYNDYLGFAYLAYLGISFLALGDIFLNRARVTTRIVNAALDALGSTFTLAPC